MRFFGLMIIRDEADVIAQTLEHLLSWADGLFILDVGSTDGTRDILAAYAARDRRVRTWLHEPVVFADTLRAMLFERYRDQFEPGDWIGRVDGDEFYHVPPPTFVRERLRMGESAIHLQWYYFRLTQNEAADYESGKIDVTQDRLRPIADRRRYYKISEYPEPRLFRYRRSMAWPSTTSFPFNAGFVARERIPIRHYPHRDPLQMAQRFALRSRMMRYQADAGGHWKLDDWRKELLDVDGKEHTRSEGLSDNAAVVAGNLLYWAPGTALPEMALHNHLPSLQIRLTQRITHPMLLPLLDRLRPRFDKRFLPRPLPPEVS